MRRVGRSFWTTCVGVGKEGWVSGKRAVNFFFMEAAAAPETCEVLEGIELIHGLKMNCSKHIAYIH